MSFIASTDSYSQGTVNVAAKTVDVTLNGSWNVTGAPGQYNELRYSFYYSGDGGSTYLHGPQHTSPLYYGYSDMSGASSGSFSFLAGASASFFTTLAKFGADKSCAFKANVFFILPSEADDKDKTGSVLYFKSYALDATASTPTSSSVTSSTATVACNFFPNTDTSTATVWMEYRIFGSGSAFTAGATSSYSGYTTQSISTGLTGLSGSTTYEYRLSMTRDTSNSTTFTSTSATFTTSASTPTVTTDAATNIGPTVATLNGHVTANGFTITAYATKWGTSSGVYPNTVTASGSDSGFSSAVTGLSTSTTYYFIAQVTVSGGATYTGSELSFSTAATAAAARIMPSVYEFEGKYGVAKTFQFCVEVPSATNSDKFLSAAVPWVAGDVLVDKDGGGFANITALPTRIGSTQLYQLTLSATEMQALQVTVMLADLDGPSWRDTLMIVKTKWQIGQLDIDATQIGSNTPGMTVTGVGTSPGILAVGGATSAGDITGALTTMVLRKSIAQAGAAATVTLDSGASATDNYYNNCVAAVVSGTGAGQARIITGYVGSTKVATVHTSWSTNPAVSSVVLVLPTDDVWNIPSSGELSAIPTSTSTFAKFLQFLFQRFAYKRTQTSTTQTLLKADSSSSLASGTVSDDGSTQSSGKLT